MEDNNVDKILASVTPTSSQDVPVDTTVDDILASVSQNPEPQTSEVDSIISELGVKQPQTPITQEFGNVNPDVEVMSGGVNNGTDFAYEYGTPVQAPQGDWIVEESYADATGHGSIGDSTNNGYGNSVKLRNPETGETIRLSHLSTNFAKPGMKVPGGSLLGLSGDTGNASGAHLDVQYTDSTGNMADVTQSPYTY